MVNELFQWPWCYLLELSFEDCSRRTVLCITFPSCHTYSVYDHQSPRAEKWNNCRPSRMVRAGSSLVHSELSLLLRPQNHERNSLLNRVPSHAVSLAYSSKLCEHVTLSVNSICQVHKCLLYIGLDALRFKMNHKFCCCLSDKYSLRLA